MRNVLCLTDTIDDISKFIHNENLHFFKIKQLEPQQHSFKFFKEIYQKLKQGIDLLSIDLIIAEYIEAIPLVYFIRKDGFFCPTIFIPHTNPYPFNILFYFLTVSELCHPLDRVLCGSTQAAVGYNFLTGIDSLPSCTFGIKSFYEQGDQTKARKIMGLPKRKKILLFTGRFMNDKGLLPLLEAYEKLRRQEPNVLLVISATHIDPFYFNICASKMQNVIFFYRLDDERMKYLYQSADLFVCGATSVFETYGKSPLEAIASNLPVVLPNWDGFPYFVTKNNGSLVKVDHCGPVKEASYSFARVNTDDFAEKILFWIKKNNITVDSILPKWAFYNETMKMLSQLTNDILEVKNKFQKQSASDKPIRFNKYPPIIKKICDFYHLETLQDLEKKTEDQGLINRENPGNIDLLKELHDILFIKMKQTTSTIFSENKGKVLEKTMKLEEGIPN